MLGIGLCARQHPSSVNTVPSVPLALRSSASFVARTPDLMSKAGLRIARLFGGRLPTFASQADAERALFEVRDNALAGLTRAASHAPEQFVPDLTPDSLKALEAWYFALIDGRQFSSVGTSREEFEQWMGFYYGAMAVHRDPGAGWVVEEYAFEPGRYEIGVRKGLVTEMLTAGFADHYTAPNNKRRQSIYRRYRSRYG